MKHLADWWQTGTNLQPRAPADSTEQSWLAVATDHIELRTVARQIYQAVRQGARLPRFSDFSPSFGSIRSGDSGHL